MRKTTLLMSFLLLAPLVAGCDPDGTNSDRPIHCEVLVDGPVKAAEAEKIVGIARFKCDRPGPETLTLKIRLEKKDGDQWHSVASTTKTLKGMETHAKGFDFQSRQAEVKCSRGVYRTVVDWTRVSRGDTEGDNLISGTAKDPCAK